MPYVASAMQPLGNYKKKQNILIDTVYGPKVRFRSKVKVVYICLKAIVKHNKCTFMAAITVITLIYMYMMHVKIDGVCNMAFYNSLNARVCLCRYTVPATASQWRQGRTSC